MPPPDPTQYDRLLKQLGGGAPAPAVPPAAGSQYERLLKQLGETATATTPVSQHQRLSAQLSEQPDWGASEMRSESREITKILPRLQPIETQEAREALYQADPAISDPGLVRLKGAEKQRKRRLSQIKNLSKELRRRGGIRNYEAAAALDEERHRAMMSEMPRPPKEASALEKVINVIDLPGQAGRALTRPGGVDWEAVEDPEAWERSMREAEKRVWAGKAKGAKDVFAAALAGGMDVGTTLAGAPHKVPQLAARKAAGLESGTTLGTFGMHVVTDPLSWISGGTSTMATSMRAALRGAKRAGLAGPELVGLSRSIGRLVSRAGEARLAPKGAENRFAYFFKKAGLDPNKGRAAFKETFGEAGEFLGRGQARIHAPFAPEAGFDVASLIGKEYAGGKAIQSALDKALRMTGAGDSIRPLYQALQLSRFLKGERRAAQGLSKVVEERLGERFLDSAKLAKNIPEAKRTWIVRNVIDPDYTGEFKKVIDSKGNVIGVTPPPAEMARWRKAYDSLSDAERAWVLDQNKAFEFAREHLVNAGLLDETQIGANLLSGMYFPRMFSKHHGWLEDIDPLKAYRPTVPRTREMQGGVPLGRLSEGGLEEAVARHHTEAADWLLKGKFDPLEVIPQYSARVGRAVARADLNKAMAPFAQPITGAVGGGWKVVQRGPLQGKKVPTAVFDLMERPFNNALESWAVMHQKRFGGRGKLHRLLNWTLRQAGKADAQFKRYALMPRTGYHVVNFLNDTLQMAADGHKNLLGSMVLARKILRGGKGKIRLAGKTMTYDEVIAEAKLMNMPIFDTGTAGRLRGEAGADYARAYGYAAKTKALRKAAGEKPRKLDSAKAVYDAPVAVGERFAGWWESTAKMSHYVWRRKMGDSPRVAAKRAMDVLLDYDNPNIFAQLLRKLGVPFSTWVAGAPAMTARIAATRPSALANVERGLQAISDPAEGEAPSWFAERGIPRQMKPGMARAYGAAREALGGSPLLEGEKLLFQGRAPFMESLNLFAEMLGKGNIDPVMLSTNPAVKMFLENWGPAGAQDLLTKQRRTMTSHGAMLPTGTHSIVPDWLAPAIRAVEAREGQHPWLTRYGSSYAVNPVYQHVFNRMIHELGGGSLKGAPVQFLGAVRHSADPARGGDILAQQTLGMTTGIPVQSVDPMTRIGNLGYAEAQKEADLAIKNILKRARRQRKAQQR